MLTGCEPSVTTGIIESPRIEVSQKRFEFSSRGGDVLLECLNSTSWRLVNLKDLSAEPKKCYYPEKDEKNHPISITCDGIVIKEVDLNTTSIHVEPSEIKHHWVLCMSVVNVFTDIDIVQN